MDLNLSTPRFHFNFFIHCYLKCDWKEFYLNFLLLLFISSLLFFSSPNNFYIYIFNLELSLLSTPRFHYNLFIQCNLKCDWKEFSLIFFLFSSSLLFCSFQVLIILIFTCSIWNFHLFQAQDFILFFLYIATLNVIESNFTLIFFFFSSSLHFCSFHV